LSKIEPILDDILGNKLNKDDIVAYPLGNSLYLGIIKKINPKMLSITRVGLNSHIIDRKYPLDVILIKDKKSLLYILNKN
jgi:hypothetical protein